MPDLLPDGWTRVRFDQMARTFSKRVDPAEAETDVYVGLEHLDPDSLRIARHGSPSDVKGNKLRFEPGHIIFGKRRAYQRKLAVADTYGICSAHAMVLEAKPEVVDPDFLPFFMQSDRFMDRAVQISVGGLSPTINWKTLRKQEFVVPPLDRQRELVEVFRGVEDVLIQSEDAVRNCLNLNDSLVVNLFLGRWTGSPKVSTEVEALPVTWGVRTFQECLTKSPQTGKSPVPTSESTGYSVLNLSALSNGIDNGGFIAMDLKSISPNSYNTSIQIKDGDVFISRSNGNVEYVGITGQATHVPEKCIFPDTMWRIDINRDLIHPRLFVKYMLSPLGRQRSDGLFREAMELWARSIGVIQSRSA